MILPTSLDMDDANEYAAQRMKLHVYNYALKTKPHLFSHTWIEIRMHTDLASHNIDNWDNLIHVSWRGNRKFCSKIRCNMFFPRGKKCSENDSLQIFKSGNTTITACEKSCRYTFLNMQVPVNSNNNLSEVTLKKMDTSMITRWSDRCDTCLLESQYIYGLGIDDYRRAPEHPTPHMDTIGTGYDISKEPYIDEKGNETTRFKLNKYYCDDFAMQYKGNYCSSGTGEKIVGFFIGDYITHSINWFFKKTIFSNTLYTVNTPNVENISSSVRSELHKLDEEYFNIDAKRFCINPKIRLSDLGITRTNSHLFWSTEYSAAGTLIEPLYVYKSVDDIAKYNETHKIKQKSFLKIVNDSLIPENLKCDITGKRNLDDIDVLKLKFPIQNVYDAEYDLEKDHFTLSQKIIQYVTMLAQFLTDVGSQILVDKIIEYVCKQIIPKLLHQLSNLIGYLEIKISEYLIKTLISKFVFGVCAKMALTFVAKTLMKTAMLSEIPYVGVALFLLNIIDLVTAIGWDPLKMNNMLNQEGIDVLSKLEIEFRKKTYNYGTWEMSPMYLVSIYRILIVNEKENIRISKDHLEKFIPQLHDISELKYLFEDTIIENTNSKDPNKYSLYDPPPVIGEKLNRVFDPNENLLLEAIYASRYLQKLKKNSNGSLIDHNDNLTAKDIKNCAQEMSAIVKIPEEEYEKQFQTFVNDFLNKRLNNSTVLLTSCVFYLCSFPIIIVICPYLITTPPKIQILIFIISFVLLYLFLVYTLLYSLQIFKVYESPNKTHISFLVQLDSKLQDILS